MNFLKQIVTFIEGMATLVVGIIIGCIFTFIILIPIQNFYIFPNSDSQRRYVGEVMALLSAPKNCIVDNLVNGFESTKGCDFPSPPGHPDIVHIYPNGDIFVRTQHNQLLLLSINYEANEQGIPLGRITWDCIGAPGRFFPAECRQPHQ